MSDRAVGKKPPEIAPSFIRNGIAADKEIVGHMACFASHAVERHDQRFDAVAVIITTEPLPVKALCAANAPAAKASLRSVSSIMPIDTRPHGSGVANVGSP
jgi:hypothetical protein